MYGDPRYDEAAGTVTLVHLRKAVDLQGRRRGKKRKHAHHRHPAGRGRRRVQVFDLDNHEYLERRVDYRAYGFQRRFLCGVVALTACSSDGKQSNEHKKSETVAQRDAAVARLVGPWGVSVLCAAPPHVGALGAADVQ